MEIAPEDLDPSLRTELTYPTTSRHRRRRDSAQSGAGNYVAETHGGSVVTVVAEEHYQPAIVAAMPDGLGNYTTWPLVVDLSVAECNPHAKVAAPCVAVLIGSEPVGFFTPNMTEQFRAMVESAMADGSRVTAAATAHQGTKGGATFWRLKVQMADPNRP